MSGISKLNQDIGVLILSIELNEIEIQSLIRKQGDDRLSDDDLINIQAEIDHLQNENNKYYKDIVILEELIRKFQEQPDEDEPQEKYKTCNELSSVNNS